MLRQSNPDGPKASGWSVMIGTWGTWGGARTSRTALALPGALIAGALLAGCSGSDAEPDTDDSADPSPSAPADPGELSVAGEYATEVLVQESSCPDLEVQPMTTTVEQEPGDFDVDLTHAGIRHDGSLQPNGAFQTTAKSVVADGQRHTLSMVGRFSTTGFVARVAAVREQDQAPKVCEYVVTWVGTKEGEPNSVPQN